MSKKTEKRAAFLAAVAEKHPNQTSITRADIITLCAEFDLPWPAWLVNDSSLRSGRGEYLIPNDGATTVVPTQKSAPVKRTKTESIQSIVPTTDSVVNLNEVSMTKAVSAISENIENTDSLVPAKLSGYVPFGHFNDVRSIVKSNKFYPMYITGLSGNGKTLMVEQVCAAEKRELIRVNITVETDEDDLIGGFRLVDGRTVWQNGPVIIAMQRGAVLLLDEVDLGSNKMMCLQPVLEGKSIFLKKINKLVTPTQGFNIIATANTKGKGSDDGRFIGTNVMNEAFLERFSITLEQEYPAAKVESKILANILAKANVEDKEFVEKLVQWAEIVRKTFADGGVSEIISTRRLVHICEAFLIFGQNREKAIQLCLNRFDADTKTSFMDLYKKLDENVTPNAQADPKARSGDEYPF
jgi:hypothetical protein